MESNKWKVFFNKMTVRIILFGVLLLSISTVSNLITSSVGPTVTATVALNQMKDTDEAHIAMRAYSTSVNDARTYGMPIVAILLGLVFFTGPVKEVMKKKEEKEKE